MLQDRILVTNVNVYNKQNRRFAFGFVARVEEILSIFIWKMLVARENDERQLLKCSKLILAAVSK